jgi:hypothetical protein
MLIDWHSHVWLPEHFTADHLAELAERTGTPDAAPALHRQAMATVDRYVIIGIQWGSLGQNIPNADFRTKVDLDHIEHRYMDAVDDNWLGRHDLRANGCTALISACCRSIVGEGSPPCCIGPGTIWFVD